MYKYIHTYMYKYILYEYVINNSYLKVKHIFKNVQRSKKKFIDFYNLKEFL